MNVNSSSQELQHLLERIVTLHRGLINVLEEEFVHMANLSSDGITEAARSKEAMLNEIWNCEQLRIKCAADLGASLGLSPEKIDLKAIAKAIGGDSAKSLGAAREALNLIITQAKELNARNRSFAESSLNRIDELKRNALGITNNTNKENYSSQGVCQPLNEQGGRLLSTEA